jgi:hypothetical protein
MKLVSSLFIVAFAVGAIMLCREYYTEEWTNSRNSLRNMNMQSDFSNKSSDIKNQTMQAFSSSDVISVKDNDHSTRNVNEADMNILPTAPSLTPSNSTSNQAICIGILASNSWTHLNDMLGQKM